MFAVVPKEDFFLNPQPLKMKALHFFKLLGNNRPATQHDTSQDMNPLDGYIFTNISKLTITENRDRWQTFVNV
jgi:hypothetical protein